MSQQLNDSGKRLPGPAHASISRRRMLGLMATGLAGASLTLPAAEAEARQTPAKAPAAANHAGGASPKSAGSWKPLFLDAHQAATLIAFEKRIAPGAAEARAHEFVDLLLSVIGPEDEQHFTTGNSAPQSSVSIGPRARQQMLDALGAFDAQARERFHKTFLNLTGAEQDTLLTAAEKAADESAQHRHYMAARNWVLGAYYSTEAGIRELGWTNRVFFPSYPNCSAT